jgi:hypothetical protein
MKKILSLLLLSSPLFSSLSLYNDSPFPLRVKVIAANGAVMGEKEIEAHGHYYMEDQLGTSDPVGENDTPFKNYADSLTPYQVFWYCAEGSVYSVCLDAAAGATVTANTCQGDYGCLNPKE